MDDRTLHVVTVVSNPLGWSSRIKLAEQAISNWLQEPNVNITLVECAYGSRSYELSKWASDSVTHVPVRATSLVWNKENLMNIGIAHLPHDAQFIATFDADIIFRVHGWATQVIRELDIYPVVQPWERCLDLGPADEQIAMHHSFASIFNAGGPILPVRPDEKFWKGDGGPYDYPHSGFAWAWKRDTLDKIGGLFEFGGMGSGDHHMALAMVGQVRTSAPPGTHSNYIAMLMRWQAGAVAHVNGKIGFAPLTIEHMFHGRKWQRYYISRWDMFVKHGFDPIADLKRNSYGVLEWAGNKPELEREWIAYLKARHEDVNTLS